MVHPKKWPAFLKRNIGQARANNNNNYAASLAEVSASWATVKAQRAGTAPLTQLTALEQATQLRSDAERTAREAETRALDEEIQARADDDDLLARDHINEQLPTAEELADDTTSVWRGGWEIGGRKGANKVTVWIRLDANGRIIERPECFCLERRHEMVGEYQRC
jgi:hypothetical protein